jgi:hypothetical protein
MSPGSLWSLLSNRQPDIYVLHNLHSTFLRIIAALLLLEILFQEKYSADPSIRHNIPGYAAVVASILCLVGQIAIASAKGTISHSSVQRDVGRDTRQKLSSVMVYTSDFGLIALTSLAIVGSIKNEGSITATEIIIFTICLTMIGVQYLRNKK